MEYPFPFVECPDHPGRQRSYAVCAHIGIATIGHCVFATDVDRGEILCSECAFTSTPASIVMCAAHLADLLTEGYKIQ